MTHTPEEWDRLYAEVALHHKLVAPDKLDEAILEAERRRSHGEDTTVSDVLLENEAIGEREHRAVDRASKYKQQRRLDKVIARIYVESEYCTQEEVMTGLQDQKTFYGKAGEVKTLEDVLIEQGITQEEHKTASRVIYEFKTSREE